VIAACRRGPINARVDAIEERDATPDELALGGGGPFTVLRTV
jgi:hypothetical protein